MFGDPVDAGGEGSGGEGEAGTAGRRDGRAGPTASKLVNQIRKLRLLHDDAYTKDIFVANIHMHPGASLPISIICLSNCKYYRAKVVNFTF